MSGRKRKIDDEKRFNPKELVIIDQMSMKGEEIMKRLLEAKEEEWESLPVVKRYEGYDTREKVMKIVNEHHHHPSNFMFSKWVSGIKESNHGSMQLIGFNDTMIEILDEMEFFVEIEKMRLKKDPILHGNDIRDFLLFFLEKFELCFNFICTDTGKFGQYALICNICSFDIIYFCVMIEVKNANLPQLLKHTTMKNGVLLLRYDFNSESIKDSEDIENKEKKQQRESDHSDYGEYKELIDILKNVKMDIKNMFYFTCPCIWEGKLNTDIVSKCINNAL